LRKRPVNLWRYWEQPWKFSGYLACRQRYEQ